jgi:4-amino-4-deoxy-L-arabinose transferase-like glycosyltransferase
MATCFSVTSLKAKICLGIVAFATLGAFILSRPAWTLQDFDQPFYITIAYDLDKWGVFSNGQLGEVDSTYTRPQSGMFFGPVYPFLILGAMKLDPRFADAVRCSVEGDRGHRDEATCEPYEIPMRLLNAFLLAIGIVAVASAAELIFGKSSIFMLAGAFALTSAAFEAGIFSYIMTESTTFAIYSVFAWATVLAWRTGRTWHFILGGGVLGLLCLTKPSYLVLFPLVVALSLLYAYRLGDHKRPRAGWRVLAFSLAFGCVVGAWVARNVISVGKFGFTEEYGSAALIERFAYNDMAAREFFQAFAYCTPGIGEIVFDPVHGTDSMHRFVYHTKGSFFHVGRDRRSTLIDQYVRLDPLISGILREEMRTNWWRHLLVSIPLAWCGMWAGWLASLFLVPMFAWACVRTVREKDPLLMLYAAPAIAMLGLDALIGNHSTRYNLVLIGPYSVGAAFVISLWLRGSARRAVRALPPSASPRIS